MGHSKQFKDTLKAQAYWFFLLPLFAEILVVKALGNRLVGGNLIHGIGFYFYDMVVPLLIPVGILVYRLNEIKPFRLSFSPRWVGANILLVFALAGWLFLFRGPAWKFPIGYAAGFLALLYGVLFSALFLAIRPKEFSARAKKMPVTTLGCVLAIWAVCLCVPVINALWEPLIYSVLFYLENLLPWIGFNQFEWHLDLGVWLYLNDINWRIKLSPTCSGLQGMFLFTYLFFLFFIRDEERLKPKAFVFFWLGGVALMFWMNISRFVLMMATTKFIQTRFSQLSAQQAFQTVLHPYSGFIFYTVGTILYFYIILAQGNSPKRTSAFWQNT